MTRQKALTLFFVCVLLIEIAGLITLGRVGADSETQACAYVLLLSAAGLGGGWIFMRFP
jgi:choline-glycine betaine transporter